MNAVFSIVGGEASWVSVAIAGFSFLTFLVTSLLAYFQ
jgi:hypothetical protein